jgi:hypothetical protein
MLSFTIRYFCLECWYWIHWTYCVWRYFAITRRNFQYVLFEHKIKWSVETITCCCRVKNIQLPEQIWAKRRRFESRPFVGKFLSKRRRRYIFQEIVYPSHCCCPQNETCLVDTFLFCELAKERDLGSTRCGRKYFFLILSRSILEFSTGLVLETFFSQLIEYTKRNHFNKI